jgi:hypothetical protein
MKPPQIIEQLVYALVVILSLATLWLVANVPENFLNARVVYQGF